MHQGILSPRLSVYPETLPILFYTSPSPAMTTQFQCSSFDWKRKIHMNSKNCISNEQVKQYIYKLETVRIKTLNKKWLCIPLPREPFHHKPAPVKRRKHMKSLYAAVELFLNMGNLSNVINGIVFTWFPSEGTPWWTIHWASITPIFSCAGWFRAKLHYQKQKQVDSSRRKPSTNLNTFS